MSPTIRAVLLDIEGTTTPIRFVYEVLFPYARRHLRRYVEQHAASPGHAPLYDRLRDEHAADRAAAEAVPPWIDEPPAARAGSILSYLEWLMDRDRKSTALKSLQGLIWEDGYRGGDLVGEVFADVPAALARWRAQRIDAGIFSSGSVLAQQLLVPPFIGWRSHVAAALALRHDDGTEDRSGQLPADRGGDGDSGRERAVRLRRRRGAGCGADGRHADAALPFGRATGRRPPAMATRRFARSTN